MSPMTQQGPSTTHRLTGIAFVLVAIVWIVVDAFLTDGVDPINVAVAIGFAAVGVFFLSLGRRSDQ